MTGLPSLPSGVENFSRKSRSGSSRSSCSAKFSSAEKAVVINRQPTSNVQRPTSNAQFRGPLLRGRLSTLNYQPSTALSRRLHQFDGCPIRVAHVDDAL